MKEWRNLQLGDIAVISYGYTAKASVENFGSKFLRITDIQKDRVNWSRVPYCPISEDDLKKYRLIDQDIVFARTGATTGKSYLVCNPPESVAASYLIRLRVQDPTILAKFISKYFQTSEYWDSVSSGISGSAQGGFNASKLSALVINIPPLPEQKRIVAILDEAFEAIDRAIANTEKNLANARELFESYLNNVFTQKGDGWVEKKLEDICSITSKLIDPRQAEFLDLPHVGAGNMISLTGELIEVKTAREEKLKSGKFIFDENMILYSKIRPYLMKACRPEFSGLCSADVYPLLPNDGQLNRDFLFHLLMSRNFTKYAIAGSDRAGMPKVNRDHLFRYSTWIPSLSQQVNIAQKIDEIATETQRLEAIYRQKLAALKELKQSILQKAFTGELTADTPKTAEEEIAA
ncbi:restriction endonuclease subunit S [Microcoleus sp. bin38.metabat.b11b12b14.051]|uniref:restriction endonuclease subunit S n=1 Tax=Microcoleus sp. bin38.metabat.b11b12b14.051 TaxID=2742709 RepID=UPI0025D5B56C|nr:restriction endonuclease subunit S [Microcoleus sp. bin38.metabat.b11b12b14.051]